MATVSSRLLALGYRLGDVIGRGSTATVYRATAVRPGKMPRTVAVKVLRDDADKQVTNAYQRFNIEISVLKELDGVPMVPKLYHDGSDETPPFFVCDYVNGATLRKVLDDHGTLGVEQSCRIVQGMLRTVAAMHKADVLHRDLKPANAMIDDAGNVWLIDLGLAITPHTAGVTVANTVVGTESYMSPARRRGNSATVKDDLYAVAVILEECLIGRGHRPSGATGAKPALAQEGATKIDPELRRIIADAKNERHGFQSADEFARALDGVLSRFRTRRVSVGKADDGTTTVTLVPQTGATSGKRTGGTSSRPGNYVTMTMKRKVGLMATAILMIVAMFAAFNVTMCLRLTRNAQRSAQSTIIWTEPATNGGGGYATATMRADDIPVSGGSENGWVIGRLYLPTHTGGDSGLLVQSTMTAAEGLERPEVGWNVMQGSAMPGGQGTFHAIASSSWRYGAPGRAIHDLRVGDWVAIRTPYFWYLYTVRAVVHADGPDLSCTSTAERTMRLWTRQGGDLLEEDRFSVVDAEFVSWGNVNEGVPQELIDADIAL